MGDDESKGGIVGAIVGIFAALFSSTSGPASIESQYADHEKVQRIERDARRERDEETQQRIDRAGE